MSQMQHLLALWESLTDTATQEEAALNMLEALDHTVNQAISKSEWSNRAIITAATLFVDEPDASSSRVYTRTTFEDDVPDDALVSQFEGVVRQGKACCFDVLLDVVYVHDQDDQWSVISHLGEDGLPQAQFSASMERLLSDNRSQATHICALPLLNTEKQIAGMLIIEARCRAAMGSTFVWSMCLDEIGAMWRLTLPFIQSDQPVESTSSSPLQTLAVSVEDLLDGDVLVEQMKLLAEALVCEAQRAQSEGVRFDIDICNALRGYVLETAREKMASLDDVYRLFNRENLVTQRNHYRSYKRELKRKNEFESLLGAL